MKDLHVQCRRNGDAVLNLKALLELFEADDRRAGRSLVCDSSVRKEDTRMPPRRGRVATRTRRPPTDVETPDRDTVTWIGPRRNVR